MTPRSFAFVLLLLPACAHAPPPPTAPPPVAALIGRQTITLAQVDQAAARRLYEVRERTLDAMITDQVLLPQAKQAGKPPNQYLRSLVETRVPTVSAEEAQAWFNENQSQLPNELSGKPFDEVGEQIIRGLTAKRRNEALPDIIAELREQAGVKILLEPPRIAVAATGPSKGPAAAKVTIIEFSDFQCPYCAKAQEALERILETYGDKVRLVFRDFPLSFHENAEKAAEAGHCAAEQGKFWELHDWMFTHQGALSVPELQRQARDMGLDAKVFADCLVAGKHASTVEQDVKDGQQAGVDGTPTFFINGVELGGLQSYDELKRQIDLALARGTATQPAAR